MADTTCTIGGLTLPFDPDSISWSFKVKTNITNTVGGKVVQVFGVKINNMMVSGSFGQGGFEAQQNFVENMTYLAEKQSNQVPLAFNYAAKGWKFEVFILRIATPDGDSSAAVRPEIINPKWSLQLMIVEENIGLKKVAADQFIARLASGIGWVPSAYNGPRNLAEQRAAAGLVSPLGTSTSGSTSEVTPTDTTGNPAASGTVWDQLAQCESGGNWQANTGNGYYGGLQFSLESWRGVGGTGYPHEATKEEQIKRAEMLRQSQGWNAWPACSLKLGLR